LGDAVKDRKDGRAIDGEPDVAAPNLDVLAELTLCFEAQLPA
jgi:hypothetical protein